MIVLGGLDHASKTVEKVKTDGKGKKKATLKSQPRYRYVFLLGMFNICHRKSGTRLTMDYIYVDDSKVRWCGNLCCSLHENNSGLHVLRASPSARPFSYARFKLIYPSWRRPTVPSSAQYNAYLPLTLSQRCLADPAYPPFYTYVPHECTRKQERV